VVVTPDRRYFYLHHAYNGTDFTFAGRQGVLSELVWDETNPLAGIQIWYDNAHSGRVACRRRAGAAAQSQFFR
jgi:hypothetical protein